MGDQTSQVHFETCTILDYTFYFTVMLLSGKIAKACQLLCIKCQVFVEGMVTGQFWQFWILLQMC